MKTLFLASATMACGLALATPASSATYNFVTLSVPGATPGNYLAVSGINDLGQAIVTEEEPNVSFDFTTINDVYNWHTDTYTPLPAYPGIDPEQHPVLRHKQRRAWSWATTMRSVSTGVASP